MDKIYRIPANLNSEFSFYGCYSLGDFIIILLLFMGFGFISASVGNLFFLTIPVIYSIGRFKTDGYSLFYWSKIAISFVVSGFSHRHVYTLFERSEERWK